MQKKVRLGISLSELHQIIWTVNFLWENRPKVIVPIIPGREYNVRSR